MLAARQLSAWQPGNLVTDIMLKEAVETMLQQLNYEEELLAYAIAAYCKLVGLLSTAFLYPLLCVFCDGCQLC